MAKPNFFNENLNRSFPFENRTVGVNTPASGVFTMIELPDDVIVDCGFIFGPESGYEEDTHTVFLHKISRVTSSQINYEFRCDAPALVDVPIVFTRQVTDGKYFTEFQENNSYANSGSSQSESLSASQADALCDETLWSGYLVTGSVANLADRLTVGTEVSRSSDSETLVLKSLIQNLNNSQAVALNLANGDRTRALRPANCPANEWNFATGQIYVNKECLQGELVFTPGYNISLSQSDRTNTIQLSAIPGAGAGSPCEEVKLFAEEAPPAGASNNLLEGDFYCNEALRTINGLQGPNFTFFAGTGVAITADAETNTVTVDVNLADLSLCTTSAVSESV